MTRASRTIIVGGGPAGAASAALLARDGRDVTILEATVGPHHTVCGEFLSGEAIAHLSELGLDPWSLGAVPIDRVTLSCGTRRISAPLPFPAAGLSRDVLDAALLDHAAAAGADVRRGARVRGLDFRDGAWQARIDTGEVVHGAEAFLATGKHDIRCWRRPAGLHPDLVGLKAHLRLPGSDTHDLNGVVELALFRDGYAGLQLVGPGVANLCLLIHRRRLKAVTGDAERLVDFVRSECPVMGSRLDGAWAGPGGVLAVAGVPFGFVRRGGPAPWRLGDQATVVPSFSGTGIALAFRSAAVAARCCRAGLDATAYHEVLAAHVGSLVRRSTLASRLLVRPWAQRSLAGLVALLPGLLSICAAGSRLPAPAPMAQGTRR